MKKTTWLLCAAALITLAVLFTGCPKEFEKVSVEDRMEMFKDDVNARDWGNLKGHTHPLSASYNLMSASAWETAFALPVLDGALTLTSLGNPATGTKDGITYTFYLKTDAPDVYKIYRIESGSTPVFQ